MRRTLPALFLVAAALLPAGRALARSGDLDPRFAGSGLVRSHPAGGGMWAEAVGTRADGTVDVVGTAQFPSGSRMAIVRLTGSGRRDRHFAGGSARLIAAAGGAGAAATAVAERPGGRVLVAGVTQGGALAVLRLRPDGRPDPTFNAGRLAQTRPVIPGPSPLSTRVKLLVIPQGHVLLAARIPGQIVVARFTPGGAVDRSFGIDGVSTALARGGEHPVAALLPATEGKVAVVADGDGEVVLQQFTGRGTPDAPDHADVPAGHYVASATLRDGGLLVGTTAADGHASAITAMYGDGTPVRGFGFGFIARVTIPNFALSSVALDRRGRPIAAGRVLVRGNSYMSVLRLTPRGRRDIHFGARGVAVVPEPRHEGRALAFWHDRILVAGPAADHLGDPDENLAERWMTVARLLG